MEIKKTSAPYLLNFLFENIIYIAYSQNIRLTSLDFLNLDLL